MYYLLMEMLIQILRLITVIWPILLVISIIGVLVGKLANPMKVNTKLFLRGGIIGAVITLLLAIFQISATYMLVSQINP